MSEQTVTEQQVAPCGNGLYRDPEPTPCFPDSVTTVRRQTGGDMKIKLAAMAALLLAQGRAMADDVRVDCAIDQRIVCRDDETTCRAPVKGNTTSATYHFAFDLTKKTGSLVYCASDIGGCLEPSPVNIVYDLCAFIGDRGTGCLGTIVSVWERIQQQTYTISETRYVMTKGGIATDHSVAVTEFGHCAVK